MNKNHPHAATSVRQMIFWAVASLGFVAIVAFSAVFLVSNRLHNQVNERTAELLADETIAETALNLAHQQMLQAARYVYAPSADTEARFRELGTEFYRVLRVYLRRDLSLDERRRVERIKEAHERLEVNAFDAFSYARSGQHDLARERTDRVAQNADFLQSEITAFLLGRRPQRDALQQEFERSMRWLYAAAILGLLLFGAGVLIINNRLRDRLVTPLQELELAAARVTPGSAPLQAAPSGVTEVHALADSFTQMSARLLSAREQTEEARRRYVSLVGTIDAIVWEAESTDFACTFVSAYAETLLGYPPREWIGDAGMWRKVIHPLDYDRIMNACRIATESGVGHQLEYRMVSRAGEVLWVRDLVRVIQGPDGSRTLRGVIFNITAQRADREALRHSEERFRTLIENASDTVTVLDAQGKTVYSGPSLKTVLGYEPEEREGKSVLEIVHPDDVDKARELLMAALQRRVEDVVVQIRARHKDGNWRWLEVKARNLLNHPGVNGLVINSTDITDRRAAQDALQASEEQLRQAQKMEAIGRLAAGVAHDFNNILTTIHGYLDLTIEHASAQPIREDLQQIKVAADRAVDLTKQLLAFGRKQMLDPEVLNVCDAVRDVQRLLVRVIGENVKFSVDCVQPDVYARVDRGQLHQLLMNLAVNARDAMPAGGELLVKVSREIMRGRVAEHLPSGEYVVIRVADTGVGMDAETAARIFEPFFTTKPVGHGTGLGLSTVYGIVKQSGGHIAVESEPGRGTTFTIWLTQVEPADGQRPARAGGAAEAQSQTTATVLVAEDEYAVRDLVRRMLTKRGYSVLSAADGQEAIEELARRADEIDIVIADMVMPRAGGGDVAAAISRLNKSIPLILMSGYSEEEVLDRARGISSNVIFINKPFSAQQLLQSIDRLLNNDGNN